MCCEYNSSPARSCKTQLLSSQQEGTAAFTSSPSQQPTLEGPPGRASGARAAVPLSPQVPGLPAARQPCRRSPPQQGHFLLRPQLSLQSKSEATFRLSARRVLAFLSASLYMLSNVLCSGEQQKWANVIPCKEEDYEDSCSSVKVPAESTFTFLQKKNNPPHKHRE